MVEWTYKEIIQAWQEGRIDEYEVLAHFAYAPPDDTPMALMPWVARFQMTGQGGELLGEMRALGRKG